MSSALIALAVEVGAPLVRRVLSERIGTGNARLAEDVLGAIATRVGVPVDGLERAVADNPDLVRQAIDQVEAITPELMQVTLAETEVREALLLQEGRAGGWGVRWRPAWMYLLGFFWLWNVVVLHVLNAVFKIALPPVEYTILLQLTGIYTALYMGGHTVKEAVKSWRGGV